MTDIRADDASSLDTDDRLPWLEAVEEEGGREGPSPLKLIVAVLIGLVAIGGFVAAAFWLIDRGRGGSGEAEVIAAPEGAYKVRPDDPGGMNVEGEGDSAFAAIDGGDPKGNINTNAVPEQPVTKGGEEPLLKAPPPTNAGAEPSQPAAAAPAAGGGGPTIQLGAFSSQAGATNAWKALSGRFTYLAPLSHNVVPVSAGGKTLYRLRASGPGAANLCGRLRVAGESCVAVD
jgi:hypothetical protein